MTRSTPHASVLIVDDELGPREAIRMVLEPRFRVMTAESGEEALDLLSHERVDLVTLDLAMPGLGGIATFEKIRELDADVQILVVSGALLDLARGLPGVAGSAWMIPKPFDITRLIEAAERAVQETRRRRLQTAELRASAFVDARAAALEVDDEGQQDVAWMFPRGDAHEAAALTVNFLGAQDSDGAALDLHKRPAALNEIVEKILEDETPRARSMGIELRADLDRRLPSVSLDVALIFRALANLLSNALHSSPDGGIVRVETRRFADFILLRVCDQGPGIPAEGMAGLLERHGRGAKPTRHSTGFSLNLVQKIVEAHGGSVFATTGPGRGSAMVVSLPCPAHENA